VKGHYTFYYVCEKIIGIDVEKRWKRWLSFEENIIKNYGKNETIHG
jgi:tRNA-(ms[2]io[6]A)-hydroxylase